MNKDIYKETYLKAIDTNYQYLSQFMERGLNILEIELVKQEIINCLMLNLSQASITLTNHLLERGLKLALIHNVVGIRPIPMEEWSTRFPEPNKKYGSLDLYNSIELCEKESLILGEEAVFLKQTIRQQFRNGFSHADMDQILKDLPSNGSFVVGSFSGDGEIKRMELPQAQNHVLQPIFQEDFAKRNAPSYFTYVYGLLIKIEQRLTNKFANHAT